MPKRTSGRGGKQRPRAAEDNQPEIVRTVEYKGKTYGPGQEDDLKDAGMEKDDLKRLEDKGYIHGFSSKKAGVTTASMQEEPGEGENERLPGEQSPIENEAEAGGAGAPEEQPTSRGRGRNR